MVARFGQLQNFANEWIRAADTLVSENLLTALPRVRANFCQCLTSETKNIILRKDLKGRNQIWFQFRLESKLSP